MNTKPNQPQSNEDTYDGSDVQDDAIANSDRDDLKWISSIKIVKGNIDIPSELLLVEDSGLVGSQ